MRPEFYTGRDGNYNAIPDICWFDEEGETPDWEKIGSCLALRMDGSKAEVLADKDDNDFFIMFNGGKKDVDFIISEPINGKSWIRVVDTGLPSPDDIIAPPDAGKPLDPTETYTVKGRSMAVLISGKQN
ncbi:hypothetical protein FACS189442_4310 [Spirochaetia bacterium]|nr:hypothetical protein FACS189442_4310 [Spirochaetia bacterium]